MYWYYNYKDGTALIFSSLTAISKETGIPLDTLKYNFSRQKKTEYYYKEDHRIVKTEVIRSKRK